MSGLFFTIVTAFRMCAYGNTALLLKKVGWGYSCRLIKPLLKAVSTRAR